MRNKQALRLATECAEALRTCGGIATALQVFKTLEKNTELCQSMPVTMATVSRSLRSLVRTRRAFPAPVEQNTGRFSLTPILQPQFVPLKEPTFVNVSVVVGKPDVAHELIGVDSDNGRTYRVPETGYTYRLRAGASGGKHVVSEGKQLEQHGAAKSTAPHLREALRMLPGSFPNGQVWGDSTVLHRVSSLPVSSGRLDSEEPTNDVVNHTGEKR